MSYMSTLAIPSQQAATAATERTAMLTTTEVITQSQLNKIDATHATVTLRAGGVLSGVTAITLSGEVLSVQPDGHFESRPVGTAGPYEVAEILPNGNLLYTPMGDAGPGYVVLGGGLK